ncbi:hypothetical protein Tco_0769081 [Tanacetum coccineum]|uniref:Uncharacterized protein n=1 Tax=Tanacetum coccineum TaxID=301880 RepID=A0ABQ4Z8K7_9ASTR
MGPTLSVEDEYADAQVQLVYQYFMQRFPNSRGLVNFSVQIFHFLAKSAQTWIRDGRSKLMVITKALTHNGLILSFRLKASATTFAFPGCCKYKFLPSIAGEAFFLFFTPIKLLVLPRKLSHRLSYFGESFDESPIVACKTKELGIPKEWLEMPIL